MNTSQEHGLVLLTGATGYVGGRLLHVLESEGCRVRCLARTPASLAPRVAPGTEIARGDALDAASVAAAMRGVDIAYYLVHSMGDARDFEALDRLAAEHFGAAARAAGVRRIVYLGGLGDSTMELSSHLRSRQDVGRILAASGVETIELRASIVIGSGSLSFEMIRALVERLPVMITPRWVSVEAQPIGIEDLLAYLNLARSVPGEGSRVYEIGGLDRLSYGDLMREYARQRGLRRWMIAVPFLTPRLSSLWLGLVTPLYARVGRKLAESLRHPTVVRDPSALDAFPLRPASVREAIASALRNEDRACAETSWFDAVSSAGPRRQWGGVRFGSRLLDSRSARVPFPPERAFAPVQRIGGDAGYYWGNWLWRLRGFLDLLAGGVGMRRGRRHPVDIRVGDAIDWWRVEAFESGRLLRLSAEMKVPGRAWLEYRVEPDGDGAVIHQTALFDPVGLSGLVYWYGIWPVHALVFRGMLRGMQNRMRNSG